MRTKRLAAAAAIALVASSCTLVWGANDVGQLGLTPLADQDQPQANSPAQKSWSHLGTSAGSTSCFIEVDQSLWCKGPAVNPTFPIHYAFASPLPLAIGTTWSQVTAGSTHACGVQTDQSLWCWGYDTVDEGLLGLGATTTALEPALVGGTDQWLQVDVDDHESCAIKSDNTLWCWGSDVAGGPPQLTPTQVGTSADWASVRVGDEHVCALKTNGTLWCWGDNDGGQLGLGDTAPRSAPTQVGTSTSWTSVSTEAGHSCGIQAPGELWCWGRNNRGQLGIGQDPSSRYTPQRVGSETDWTSVGVGFWYSCAIRSPGTMWCWGQFGHLGPDVPPDQTRTFPTRIDQRSDWTANVEGRSCGLRANGGAYCWGGAIQRQTLHSRTLSAGTAHGCEKRSNDEKWCWGSNSDGQLGPGAPSNGQPHRIDASTDGYRSRPVAVGNYTCIWDRVNGDQTLRCAGDNEFGQLGIGNTIDQPDFVAVPLPPHQTGLRTSLGATHSCTVDTQNGALYCWGRNDQGQLGLGDTIDRSTPTRVGTGNTWYRAVVGDGHTCVQNLNDIVWCFGDNSRGQLGDGTTTDSLVPMKTVGPMVDGLEAAGDHTCAIDKAAGSLWCWGANDRGQLGDGTTTDRSTRQQVGVSTSWGDYDLGGQHTCGVVDETNLLCWGANDRGQLGDGTTTDRSVPTSPTYQLDREIFALGSDFTLTAFAYE